MAEVASQYSDRSVIARLAAALVAVGRWQVARGVSDPAVDDLLDVLWTFPTVGGPTFKPWHARWEADPFRQDMANVDQGEPAPLCGRVQQSAAAQGARGAALLSGLTHAVEIVGDNLFKAVDDTRTLDHLVALEAIMDREDVALPPASAFGDQAFTDFHGWGFPVDADTVTRWRALVDED